MELVSLVKRKWLILDDSITRIVVSTDEILRYVISLVIAIKNRVKVFWDYGLTTFREEIKWLKV